MDDDKIVIARDFGKAKREAIESWRRWTIAARGKEAVSDNPHLKPIGGHDNSERNLLPHPGLTPEPSYLRQRKNSG